MFRLLILAVAAAITCFDAQTETMEDVDTATRSIFFNDIYDITILTPDGSLSAADLSDPTVAKSAILVSLYSGDLPDIPEDWTSELKPAASDDQMEDLRAAYNQLEQGDRITLDYTPSTGTLIKLNSETVVETPTHQLTHAVLDIWFGETPVSQSIKDQFLDTD